MSDKPSLDAMVAAYRKIREAKYEKEAAHKEEVAELNTQLDALSAKLLDIFNEQEVESLRTASGTVTRRVITRFWAGDWESMYEFIREHDAPYLLEQRIHSGNMKQFLEENPDLAPIGLNTDTRYAISVRKPANK